MLIEKVKVYNISKTTTFSELMSKTVNFKMSPISGKTEITDGVKNLNSIFNIINEQTPAFEDVNLVLCCYGLMCVSNPHKQKNVPLGTLILREAGGICYCKGNSYFLISKSIYVSMSYMFR